MLRLRRDFFRTRSIMPATLDLACPKCGKKLKVPAELEGKKVKCKDCQSVFAVTAPKAKSAKPAT